MVKLRGRNIGLVKIKTNSELKRAFWVIFTIKSGLERFFEKRPSKLNQLRPISFSAANNDVDRLTPRGGEGLDFVKHHLGTAEFSV